MTPVQLLIGHREVLDLFDRLIARRRLPGAVLLVGPPNIGKSTLARTCAARLLGGTDAARVLTHTDVLHLDPATDVHSPDGIAGLLQRVHERPLVAPRRVVLLEDVDRLSEAAAALLLKALEDAPASAAFFLTAITRDRVAPTVRSRTLVLELPPVADEELIAGLRARGVRDTEATSLARLAGGRPGLALRLAADDDLRERYGGWARFCGQPSTSFRSVSDLATSLDDSALAEEFLLFLQGVIRGRRPSLPLLRRAREGHALLRQYVPPRLVVEYVLAPLTA